MEGESGRLYCRPRDGIFGPRTVRLSKIVLQLRSLETRTTTDLLHVGRNEKMNASWLDSNLQIGVVTGIGHGSTLLSSFDDALRRCGVYNYNLIALSSIIPAGSEVIDVFHAPDDEFGHRLYVVKAESRSDEVGRVVAAGIGWYQWSDGRG